MLTFFQPAAMQPGYSLKIMTVCLFTTTMRLSHLGTKKTLKWDWSDLDWGSVWSFTSVLFNSITLISSVVAKQSKMSWRSFGTTEKHLCHNLSVLSTLSWCISPTTSTIYFLLNSREMAPLFIILCHMPQCYFWTSTFTSFIMINN